MTILYDPGAPYINTALRWTGTVMPCVLGRKGFWLFLGMHITVCFMSRKGLLRGDDEAPDEDLFLDWNDVKVISGITTFFEVFYTNQSFSRYLQLYELMKDMMSEAIFFVYEARLFMGHDAMGYVRLAARFYLCSIFLFIVQMPENHESNSVQWNELTKLGLITDEEKRCLESYDKLARPWIVLHWCGSAIKAGHSKSSAPANTLMKILGHVQKGRDKQQAVLDTMALPLPFQYFHLLNVMIVVNLLLWGYGMGITGSMFSPAIFFFAAMIFMGMMELASQLADPFGTDDADFPLNTWMSDLLADAEVMLEYEYPGCKDNWQAALERETRFVIGPREFKVQWSDDEGEGERTPLRSASAGALMDGLRWGDSLRMGDSARMASPRGMRMPGKYGPHGRPGSIAKRPK
eukprot:gnl/TRDRNA2_/TRDRNA2_188712_c0_seq1.p1 gnl/TRDRNA2_/TRDRNA2_188712_c0~~gnl/TRDRNA2_/TRDRNA2_188712_c0_seq1.p1  ORF type:complete len:406 (-),score=76.39 gnl/TRDRNA2_/TRDRNA2_188712_c0_seq1:47-1264(-)